jgi:hypothetical protein
MGRVAHVGVVVNPRTPDGEDAHDGFRVMVRAVANEVAKRIITGCLTHCVNLCGTYLWPAVPVLWRALARPAALPTMS